MQATFDGAQSNARNHDSKKETVQTLRLIARMGGKLSVVCDARFYMSRTGDGASPVYCALWVSGNDTYTSGRGIARGYGYHKMSGALSEAIESAGFKLDKDISGVGQEAMREAMLAIAQCIGADTAEFLFV